MERKQHWEDVYETKTPDQVSWTQKEPTRSMALILSLTQNKTDQIIDIGGGDSNLVDHLLSLGYENITVLDISAKAIERAKKRLGEKAKLVTWVVSDIVNFEPTVKYEIWHDRAAFHFLTQKEEINQYVELTKKAVEKHMIIATFSESGPLKCSGLEISQYNANSIHEVFNAGFTLEDFHLEDHTTPFDTKQNFLFCTFKKK